MSGQTIEGTWSNNAGKISIVGKWSWMNGISAIDDFREMDIRIGLLKDTPREHVSISSGLMHKIYESSFQIDRLEKKEKPKPIQ